MYNSMENPILNVIFLSVVVFFIFATFLKAFLDCDVRDIKIRGITETENTSALIIIFICCSLFAYYIKNEYSRIYNEHSLLCQLFIIACLIVMIAIGFKYIKRTLKTKQTNKKLFAVLKIRSLANATRLLRKTNNPELEILIELIKTGTTSRANNAMRAVNELVKQKMNLISDNEA